MNSEGSFYNWTLDELKVRLAGLGKEVYRAQQLMRWVYAEGLSEFAAMTNLSKAFRSELPQMFSLELPKIVSELKSTDRTRKYLFDVGEGKTVEAVLIPSNERLTLCLSSEVGCNMACSFCFTGKQKLKRRLAAADIVGQFMAVKKRLEPGERISNIVFMGMGEPLDNPEAVFKAIDIFHSPWGLNLSRRKITVSTSGLVPQIPLVTKSGTRLAVSLNAVTDELRDRIMPINRKWPLKDLLGACRQHADESGDRVTFEYVLLKGVTDSLADARALYQLTRKVPCKINIIPFNEHPDSDFQRPEEDRIQAFHRELMRVGAHVLRRKTMGRDIYAACGQLTSHYEDHPLRM
jgi:23S rRNA (adenine2503-C2)-methyltransferase